MTNPRQAAQSTNRQRALSTAPGSSPYRRYQYSRDTLYLLGNRTMRPTKTEQA